MPGPWEVAFDPKWGGPERVTFDTLQDWSKRPEEGIKFYSGTSTPYFAAVPEDVDGRDKPGHDGETVVRPLNLTPMGMNTRPARRSDGWD